MNPTICPGFLSQVPTLYSDSTRIRNRRLVHVEQPEKDGLKLRSGFEPKP